MRRLGRLLRRALLHNVGRRVPTAAQLALAVVAASAAVVILASPNAARGQGPQLPASQGVTAAGKVAQGRALFLAGCSVCHGVDARGVDGRAPSLIGVGAGAADFYLSTGRMPLERPGIQPQRSEPAYSRPQIDALVAYVGSLGRGGVPIPDVRPERGQLPEGQRLFTQYCAGCHQIMGEGGMTTGAYTPDLKQSTPRQIGEAIRIGPYVMSRWNERAISDSQVNSIARYVTQVVQRPPDAGGWGIGHVGPVPEGIVAWFVLGLSTIMVIRIIGERTTQ